MVLLDKLVDGDDREWKKFDDESKPNIRKTLRYFGCSEQLLDDLFQETMAALYVQIAVEKTTVIKSNIDGYTKIIARNTFYKHLRGAKMFDPLDDKHKELEDEIEIAESNDWDILIGMKDVDTCFEHFQDNCEQVLELKYFEGKKDREVAEILGYKNAATVKATRNNCMNKLKKCISNLKNT